MGSSGAGFPVAALDWLACPLDGTSPLALTVSDGGSAPPGGPSSAVRRGTLSCPTCGRQFPLEDGIPQLLPEPAALEPEEAQAKADERGQRDREAGIYDRNLPLRLLSLAELPMTLARLAPGPAETVLEVGCGTGRFTAALAGRAGKLLALDHSRESLRRARDKAGAGAVFVQADASYLPVRSDWATRVLSCQMLEHLPTAASRARAVAEMARALRPGGTLVLSAYWHQPLLSSFTPKEGRHSGQIYFFRFSRRELAELLRSHVQLRGITGRLGYILLADGVKP